jgi:hypothetical protein
MKAAARRFAVSSLIAAVLWVSGCKHEPNPPTEQDAIAVWKNINKRGPLANGAELLSFKKTNGQMGEVNGVRTYTLYYSATEKNLVRVGIHPPGWVDSWSSNYPFQWTEKGWLGPDGQVYPDQ